MSDTRHIDVGVGGGPRGPRGGDQMKYRHLRTIHELFKHDGDAITLLCLANAVAAAGGRPLRFREMARTINDSNEYMPESGLPRCTHRLEHGGLITIDRTDTRHPLYRPTAAGEQMVAALTIMLNSFNDNDNDNDDDGVGDDDDGSPVAPP